MILLNFLRVQKEKSEIETFGIYLVDALYRSKKIFEFSDCCYLKINEDKELWISIKTKLGNMDVILKNVDLE
jgi:hypothetical protein